MQPFILVTIRHDKINLHTEVDYMIGFDIIPNVFIKKKKSAAILVYQIAMKPYRRRGDMAGAWAVKSIAEFF